MNLYGKILLYCLCCCCITKVYAQSTSGTSPAAFDLKKLLPTSPEAAMLGRFGDVPIGYYTGTADVSIPLYTIKEGGIEIPVVLRYHGSGIKLEDQASEAGLGWSLDPGGAIIKSVNGIDDDGDDLPTADVTGYNFLMNHIAVSGTYNSRNQVGFGVFPCFSASTPGTEDSRRTTEQLFAGYGQPDLFQYSFPGGHSGKFYINTAGEIVPLDKTEEITFTGRGPWVATTLDGIRYTFNAQERATNSFVNDYVGYTWKLTAINFPNGKTINFDYMAGYYEWYVYNETYHTEYPFSLGSNELFKKPFSDVAKHETQYLTKITAQDVTIVFNLEDRNDLIGSVNGDGDGNAANGTKSVKRIKSVDILETATNKKIRTFNFTYDYFSAAGDISFVPLQGNAADDVLSLRLKLLSVQETGYDVAGQSLTNPPYTFNYDERVKLSLKTGMARDYWGYYNGAVNTCLLPDLSYFAAAGYYPVEFPLGYPVNSNISAANRAPDTSKVQAYTLKRIHYPTGGFTEFDYESNSFSNYNYPDQNKINEVHQSIFVQDLNQSFDKKSQQFTLSKSMTLRFNNTVTSGLPSNPYRFADVSPSVITLSKTVNGVTTVMNTWRMSSADQTAFDQARSFSWTEDVFIPFTSGAVYTLATDFPDNLVPQQGVSATASSSSFCNFDDIPTATVNLSYGGGCRVKEIRNYTQEGTLASRKVLKYVNADGSSSGLLMSQLRNASGRMMYFEALTDPTTFASRVAQTSEVWFYAAESFTPYATAAGGNVIGYSRVEEIEMAPDGTTNGKHVYNYHNQPSSTSDNAPDNPDLLNGSLESEEIRDAHNNLLASNAYNYTDLHTATAMGVKAFKNYVIGWDCTGNFSGLTPNYSENSILYLYYPLNSHWYKMQHKTSTETANGIALTKSEDYTYNVKGQLVKTDSKDSKQRKLTTSTVYPIDNNTLCGATLLLSNNLLSSPLEVTSLVNDVPVADTKICYRLENSLVVQDNIISTFNGGTPFTDVTFDKYGAFSNLQQVTQRGTTTVILWSDDNLYPIAQVQNAAYSQVAFTSFEDRESGNWNIPANGVTSATTPHSGMKCYDVSVASIGIGLDPQTTYKVSYWTTSGSPYSLDGTIGAPLKGATSGAWTYYEHRINNQHGISFSGGGLIDDVRVHPEQSLMTSYVNLPLIGISMKMDADGRPSYYKYDALGRLIYITDKDGNILKQFNYNYGNTPQ